MRNNVLEYDPFGPSLGLAHPEGWCIPYLLLTAAPETRQGRRGAVGRDDVHFLYSRPKKWVRNSPRLLDRKEVVGISRTFANKKWKVVIELSSIDNSITTFYFYLRMCKRCQIPLFCPTGSDFRELNYLADRSSKVPRWDSQSPPCCNSGKLRSTISYKQPQDRI